MVEYFNSRQKIVKKGDVFGVYCYGKFNEDTDKGGNKMKTKFITGGRGTGKTTQLIKEAVESPWRSLIIAADHPRADYIKGMLYKMYGNRNFVPVVTIRELLIHPREIRERFSFIAPPKLYFNDLIPCLYNAIDSPFDACDIAAAVIDTEEEPIKQYCINDAKVTFDIWTTTQTKPHIDHVIFNGPATIVFWKDGTKTVVKYDGKGRKDRKMAIMYAFMRKIYGEGRPYHDILNEIEEALK